MNRKQQETRRMATHQFMRSLDDLESVFQPTDDVPRSGSEPAPNAAKHPSTESDGFSDSPLDDVVRDIEQFMAEFTAADEL